MTTSNLIALLAIGQVHTQVGTSQGIGLKDLNLNAPQLETVKPKTVETGKSFEIRGKNLPPKAFVVFKRNGGGGTVENGGYGTADAAGSSETSRRVQVPANLKPGAFKIKLVSMDHRKQTNEADLQVVYEQMDIAVTFQSFKCLTETGDSGDSDETYFFANTFANDNMFEHFATRVFEDTDSGQTKSSPLLLGKAPSNAIRNWGFLVGLGECDNYNWRGNWIYGYHKYYKDLDADKNTWGLLVSKTIKSILYDECFRFDGQFYGKVKKVEDLMIVSPLGIARGVTLFGDELIGFKWLKVTEADVETALASKGDQPVVKTFDFKGDGSHYQVTVHIRAVPASR